MSQSSGHVTHVLLTRSRLCPGPKPGSSLHLHVLGTPPAFVLSQDQTLREELLTKSCQEISLALKWRCGHTAVPDGRILGLFAGGRGPRLHARPHLAAIGSSKYTGELRGTRRVNLSNRRPASPLRSRPTTGRTWTHTRPWTGRGAHAVEFSKTVASWKKGIPSRGCAARRCRRSGQMSIAASRLGGAIAPNLGDACCALCLQKGSAVAIGLRFRRFRGLNRAVSTACSDQVDPCKAPLAEL